MQYIPKKMPVTQQPLLIRGVFCPLTPSEHPPEPQKCLAGRYFMSTTLNYRNFIHIYPRNALNRAAVAQKGVIWPPDPPQNIALTPESVLPANILCLLL